MSCMDITKGIISTHFKIVRKRGQETLRVNQALLNDHHYFRRLAQTGSTILVCWKDLNMLVKIVKS